MPSSDSSCSAAGPPPHQAAFLVRAAPGAGNETNRRLPPCRPATTLPHNYPATLHWPSTGPAGLPAHCHTTILPPCRFSNCHTIILPHNYTATTLSPCKPAIHNLTAAAVSTLQQPSTLSSCNQPFFIGFFYKLGDQIKYNINRNAGGGKRS